MAQTYRILVAEDSEPIASLLNDVLNRCNHSVTICTNGDDALEALKKEPPDLLITDIMMPGIDGVELSEAIRKLDARIPVLFISGSLDEENVASRLMREMVVNLRSGFLRKPFTIQDIVMKVESMLRLRFIQTQESTLD